MKVTVFSLLAFLLAIKAYPQDFSGTYTLASQGNILLKLEKNETGVYTGLMTGNNNTIVLTGQVMNGMLTGKVGDTNSNIVFAAAIQGQALTLTLAETDFYGNLNTATAQVLSFTRTGVVVPPAGQVQGDVVINGSALSKDQLNEISKRYGVEPKPGSYWYDSSSGLYGVVGYPSYGFMYPGHNFGTLKRDVSGGNTSVLVNGRELPQLEWAVWSYIIGYYIQPGSYWLDGNGNVGYQGSNIPVLNLFEIARKNAYSGKGGAGDNFWSTRFSAGNSNADNTQGYVSVPGYGPVGYGF